MSGFEDLKELDRRAQAMPEVKVDVADAVLARLRKGEPLDLRITGESAPIRILAGASLLAVAAALVVVVIVWTTLDTHVDPVDPVTQQTSEWLL